MESSEDTAAAMAQAMGFSSFGAQGTPNKRRKFNPRTDAVVASTSTSTLPLHNDAALKTTTGSNTIPLGVRTQNEDEIDLEDEEEEPVAPTNEVPSHLKDGRGNTDANNPGPQYLDTSRPSTIDPANEVQSEIDSIVNTSSEWPGMASLSSFRGSRGGRRGRGPWEGYQLDRGRGGYHINQGHGGEPAKKWWVSYYDPSSNVNPWEHHEKTRGLEATAGWMSWEEAKG
ncbi:hypothetical protein GGR52DRAFT_68131 [Hypoxylon sp. FL1284]|nr:hypothetical protein GGR52DRAFT_68131 [Hypoxylon sp. FL1284]